MIKAHNLSKSFRSRFTSVPAVSDLSFEVATGKVTGFLGPNGAGKSTTMRLMLGLDIGRGYTTFDSKRLNQYSRPSEVVGILLEAKAFHPTRSARNHLKVLADAGGIDLGRVEEVLDIVGLKDVAKRGPGKFSLGMSQRLGIAAAILGQPKYLILDEPANGLDPEGIAWLRNFLRDYAQEGNGVLVSSHLLSEMSQMAENVIVLGKGKLIADTSIKQLTAKSHSGAYVRSSKLKDLEKALKDSKMTYKRSGAGFEVDGATTDRIGKLAAERGIDVLELTKREASLEQAFLDITEDAQEFRGKDASGANE